MAHEIRLGTRIAGLLVYPAIAIEFLKSKMACHVLKHILTERKGSPSFHAKAAPGGVAVFLYIQKGELTIS